MFASVGLGAVAPYNLGRANHLCGLNKPCTSTGPHVLPFSTKNVPFCECLHPLLSCPAAATSRRQRGSLNDTQRSRTDWQKRDEHTWQKVVPPWWCEHKTVHFASEWPAVALGGLASCCPVGWLLQVFA